MIDTMLFAADIPAGTYAPGDEVVFTQIAGPTVVRDGLGQPILKSINTGALYVGSTSRCMIRYEVQNSNWNDPIMNSPSSLNDPTGLSEKSTGYQNGNDCPLQVNSGFTVKGTWFQNQTTTIDNSVFVTIDIEYPDVGAVVNPAGESGTPASIIYDLGSAFPVGLCGTLVGATWTEKSFDSFKAGYRYLMQKISVETEQSTIFGFIRISGGASMGGLARIIPMSSLSSAVGKVIDYAPVEVKGPFTIGAIFLTNTTFTAQVNLVVDYVKR